MSSMKTLLQSKMILRQGIKLKWIHQRMERLSFTWDNASDTVLINNKELFSNPKHILLFPGLLSEYSAYDFAGYAFKGGYLGELIQWSDFIATLHLLNHIVVIATSYKQLEQAVSKGIKYDLIFTDYLGMNGIHKAQLIGTYKCKLRILDSFGTEPKFSFRTKDYIADKNGAGFASWGLQSYRQFWTLYPHTPDNSFLGFVIEHPKESPLHSQRKNQAVIYGKNGNYVNQVGQYKHYLDVIGSVVELHATMNNAGLYIPESAINHGVLSQKKLITLLKQSRLFIGFGFPYEGPGPLEALAYGCAFIHPTFSKPHNKYNQDFFYSKPTERGYTSQNPYLETSVGPPYVYTIDANDDDVIKQTVKDALERTNFSSYIPLEFTQEGMLERIGHYILHQNYCEQQSNIALKKQVSSSNREANPVGPVDGKETMDTCFRSELPQPQWWMVDLSSLVHIDSIKLTTAFDWYDLESLGFLTTPIQVSLLDNDKVSVSSILFEDIRLSYYWYNIDESIRYIRVDTVNDNTDSTTLTICSIGVYAAGETTPVIWPHPSNLVIVQSEVGKTCSDTCSNSKMVCEPEYFNLLNKRDVVENHFKCKKTIELIYDYVAYAPAIATVDDNTIIAGDCVINRNRELLGCAGHHEKYKRLCPCRTHKSGQIALPV